MGNDFSEFISSIDLWFCLDFVKISVMFISESRSLTLKTGFPDGMCIRSKTLTCVHDHCLLQICENFTSNCNFFGTK